MKYSNREIEILAPVGSFETLTTAINAGADSVFFGIADFNMRATAAANFKPEDLNEIVRICTENGVKTYLTLNTLMYNDELDKMKHIVDLVKEAGVTAIIAADIATIQYAREVGVSVHISTQLSISNTDNVKFWAQFADCIVLARELTLEQVQEICEFIKNEDIRGPGGELLKVEVFAHGAMCVAVSGRCAMSMFCYGTSANRGRCTQICRRRYKVTDIATGMELEIDNNYVMSAADLCTIGMLPELLNSGVSVLKFEGRGRSPEYVDTVIRTYREAIASIESGNYTPENIDAWNEKLGTVFNRGLSQGNYMGRKYDEWAGSHGNKATKERILLGEVEKYYPKISVAQIKITAKEEVNDGDEFSITGPNTGVVKGNISKMVIDEREVTTAGQGDVITFEIDNRVRRNDKVYVIRQRESTIPRGREKLLAE